MGSVSPVPLLTPPGKTKKGMTSTGCRGHTLSWFIPAEEVTGSRGELSSIRAAGSTSGTMYFLEDVEGLQSAVDGGDSTDDRGNGPEDAAQLIHTFCGREFRVVIAVLALTAA